jgi:hypothetical protein
MSVLVLVLGLLVFAAGVAAVGFGFAIKEFSLGSTLVIAGTTALVGGLVMIAAAAAIRELRRLGAALAARPMPRVPARPPAINAPRVPPVQPAFPASPVQARESRFAAAPGFAEPAAPPQPSAPATAEAQAAPDQTPVVEEAETIPLSPHEEPRLPLFDMPDERQELPREAQPEAQPQPGGYDTAATSAQQEAEADRARQSSFDVIWPPREWVTEAPPEAAPPIAEPETVRQPADAPSEPGAPVSILKSGVVDGMAYTLYSDGSIEAELPSGTIRFESIGALRKHLEEAE